MHGLQTCLSKYSAVKGEVGGHVLNSHGNYVVDHGKSWKNYGIVFLNFCGNPVNYCSVLFQGYW